MNTNEESFKPKLAPEMLEKGNEGPSLEDDEVICLFDEEAQQVMKRLVEGPTESLDIIPMVGMPGVGKTTLVRKIYNDPKLSFEFFSRVWVYAGQEYKIKDIFLTILEVFTKSIEEHLNEDEDTLAKVISGYISKGGRCLIVLDDVWEAQVVDHVKKVFAESKKGHRILMTTRIGDVAAYANPAPLNLRLLTPEESFELLVERAFGKGGCPDELVEVGQQIAERCYGLPLAVVTIARALRGRFDKYHWLIVKENMAEHLGYFNVFCRP